MVDRFGPATTVWRVKIRTMSDVQSPTAARSRAIRRDVSVTVGVVAALLLVFGTLPLTDRDGRAWWVIGLAVIGLFVLMGMLLRMLARGANLFRLLNLLLTVVITLALSFYAMASNMSGQFAGLHTRIDALYFTLTTMTTTGYGDIHATGQLARVVVSLAFVFDVVFLGLVGSELSNLAARRRTRSRSEHDK